VPSRSSSCRRRRSATGRREDLLRREAEGWERLDRALDGLSPEQLERPGLTPDGWSVKDLLWHVAVWCEDTTRVLGEMRAETWDEHDPSLEPGWTDRANRAAFDRSRTMDLETAREACRMQRTRMIEAYGTLVAPTPEADEWFDETGPGHYTEHLPGLEAWVARLRSVA
jgi:hypothetical protein